MSVARAHCERRRLIHEFRQNRDALHRFRCFELNSLLRGKKQTTRLTLPIIDVVQSGISS
jgi:hypothetical protein